MSSDASDAPRYESDNDAYDDEDMRLEALGARGVRADSDAASGASSDGYPAAYVSAATGVSLLKAKLKDAARQVKRLEDERRLLRDENDGLRRRDVEMMALGTQLNHRFQSLQLQVDSIKVNIRAQLVDPISDEEYRQLESLAEGDRDLIATVKLGIYQQLGSMRASRDTAVRRCSEMATELESMTSKNKSLGQKVLDMQVTREAEQSDFRRQLASFEQRASHVAELSGKVQDLESKLKGAYVEQDQLLHAKLTASTKASELARAQLLVKELETDAERYKAQSECNEQKLDILKSEFYDLRLKYQQRIAELEGQLRLAEERLKVVGDFELEAEAFMTHMATAIEDGLDIQGTSSSAIADACGKLMCVPSSRKVHHAVTVTRKCLQLDNQLAVLRSELKRSEERGARLEQSLQLCRAALNQTNSPFALAEGAIETLTNENNTMSSQNQALRSENQQLQHQVKELLSDVALLSKHRSELVRIREVLCQMGAPAALTNVPQLTPPAPASSGAGSSAQRSKPCVQTPQPSAAAKSTNRDIDGVHLAEPRFAAAQQAHQTRDAMRREGGGAFSSVPELIEIC